MLSNTPGLVVAHLLIAFGLLLIMAEPLNAATTNEVLTPTSTQQQLAAFWAQHTRHADPLVRKAAVRNLGRLKAHSALPILFQGLAEDEDQSVRREAAKSIGLIGDPRSLDGLTRALKQERQPTVKRRIRRTIDLIKQRQAQENSSVGVSE